MTRKLPNKSALLAEKRKLERESPMYPIMPRGWYLNTHRRGNQPKNRVLLRRLKQDDIAPLPNGKNSMYLPEGSPEHSHYLAMWTRRQKMDAIAAALAQFDRLDAIRSRTATDEPSPEWYTPPEFIEMARTVMEAIDLDPASNATAQGWVKAAQFYTKDDNGLAQPWSGRVWCNPPYGKFTKLFMQRGLEFYRAGQVSECIFLVNRSGAAWYVDLQEEFTALCQVRKRISFWTPEGKPEGSPRYNNDFLYLGTNPTRFREVFATVGRV
jgi:hypothetical protein